MKRTVVLMFLLGMFMSGIHAQGINYQTVLRNDQGVVTNAPVDVMFNVYAGESQVFTETHNTQSNAYGLINLVIGESNAVDWEVIDWSTQNHSLEVLMDFGNGFMDFGIHPFKAVPYALRATQMSINDLTDIDLNNPEEGDVIKWEGGEWSPADDSDNQMLLLVGNTLEITGGNSVDLEEIVVGGDDWGDQITETDPTLTGDGTGFDPIGIAKQGAMEGDVLKWDGATWRPAEDENTDAQTLTVAGNSLIIQNGNTVQIPGADGDISEVTAGQGLTGGGSEGAVEIAARTSQPLWNANKLLSRSIASAAPADGDVLSWNSSSAVWEPGEAPDDGDWDLHWDGEEYSLEAIYDVNTTEDIGCTSLSASWATIANTITASKGAFWKNSTLSNPHIDIYETSSNDYTRLRMRSYESSNYWDIASRPGTSSFSARVNFFFSGVGDVLVLRGNGNMLIAGSLTQNSDRRLKTDIQPLDASLDKTLSLTGYNFRWKDKNMDQTIQTGLIAQEVQSVLPSLVETDPETDYLSINYSGLVPVLIEAIKEQDKTIRKNEDKIEELEARILKLEQLLTHKTVEQ